MMWILRKIVGFMAMVVGVGGAASTCSGETFFDDQLIDGVAGIAAFFEACDGSDGRDWVLDRFRVIRKSLGTPTTAVDLQGLMIRHRSASQSIDTALCTDQERKRQVNLLDDLLKSVP